MILTKIIEKYIIDMEDFMRKFVSAVIFVLLIFLLTSCASYNREKNQIRDELNMLENVEVLNIWANEKDIWARLRINEDGEIGLSRLNNVSTLYPNHVPISAIGGYSFICFYGKGGFSYTIDIGIQGLFGHLFGIEFKTVKEVIDNYDIIFETFNNLKISPEINYFETETSEWYLLIHRENSEDQNSIFNLLGNRGLHDYSKNLKWNRDDSFHNRYK
jgi:hypothetical protein